jgi:hypothetical protein
MQGVSNLILYTLEQLNVKTQGKLALLQAADQASEAVWTPLLVTWLAAHFPVLHLTLGDVRQITSMIKAKGDGHIRRVTIMFISGKTVQIDIPKSEAPTTTWPRVLSDIVNLVCYSTLTLPKWRDELKCQNLYPIDRKTGHDYIEDKYDMAGALGKEVERLVKTVERIQTAARVVEG